MIKKKKSFKNRKSFKKNKILVFLIICTLFLVGGLLYYEFFLYSSPLISPLAKNKITADQKLEDLLTQKNIDYTLITSNNSFYTISVKDNGEVIVSSTKDLKKQIDSLQLILGRLTIEGKRFKSLDLRFDKPVVSF